VILNTITRGGSSGGHTPSLKLEKIWFFGIKLWFITRNTPKIFAPSYARRNFFKCTPSLTWNSGYTPDNPNPKPPKIWSTRIIIFPLIFVGHETQNTHIIFGLLEPRLNKLILINLEKFYFAVYSIVRFTIYV
jgi:hypothetical protein